MVLSKKEGGGRGKKDSRKRRMSQGKREKKMTQKGQKVLPTNQEKNHNVNKRKKTLWVDHPKNGPTLTPRASRNGDGEKKAKKTRRRKVSLGTSQRQERTGSRPHQGRLQKSAFHAFTEVKGGGQSGGEKGEGTLGNEEGRISGLKSATKKNRLRGGSDSYFFSGRKRGKELSGGGNFGGSGPLRGVREKAGKPDT